MPVKITFLLEGVVQGVGLRPAVYRLAEETKLGGSIQNLSGRVLLTLEGSESKIDNFISKLPGKLPSQARLDNIIESRREEISEALRPSQSPVFKILGSAEGCDRKVVIPADLAMCAKCAEEIRDTENRRYLYPFTTCTDCGPRYTVINSMPYDRERTTMFAFPLCPDCRSEYEDSSNRRFHAESIACPACGPELFLTGLNGALIDKKNPLKRARLEIFKGKIVAVRGIGGFLLAADPFNSKILELLRKRKNRPCKPFAVMARNLEAASRFCKVGKEAEKLLTSERAPIVILDLKTNIPWELPFELLSPDTHTLGVMLPYSPLHKMLFEPFEDDKTPAFDMLVMTSGNKRDEPICISNEEAFERLKGIADFILCHNREINLRNDDSVCAVQTGKPQVWRRARGYAPEVIRLKKSLKKCVLAMGAEVKNTIALGYDNEVVLSPHIGDLETPEALDHLEKITEYLPKFLNKLPEAVAVDSHPDMHSTILGRKTAGALNIPVVEIQHHHAHAVSCMAENNIQKALALVFDGTGLGTDGNIWGAELFYVPSTDKTPERLATFAPVPLPGGNAAVKQPFRQLAARLYNAGIRMPDEWLKKNDVSEDELNIWLAQCEKGINTPYSHAAGRLFDSFAVLLGISPDYISYEGQAAIRLETLASKAQNAAGVADIPFSEYEKNNMFFIDWSPAFQKFADSKFQISNRKFQIANFKSQIAFAFHRAVAKSAIRMIEYGIARLPPPSGRNAVRNVALSGGVFMNRILNELLIPAIKKLGLNVFIHRKIPPNDGGISLGQAVMAGNDK